VFITEVRTTLATPRSNSGLLAYSSVAFDGAFVVKDVKVVDGPHGLIVSMPSKEIQDRCPSCGEKNALRARYCSQCGDRLADYRASRDDGGRLVLRIDTVHPITAEFRAAINDAVTGAYADEFMRDRGPAPPIVGPPLAERLARRGA
jgi:stage V sporulation protein G